ncbi:MAG: cysteine--tRNA ligase [Candidatus Sumerlaeia bacterium]|nr:cysteine--tRNA ligase [Candidatus Sumerlaeia bacterium]
MSIHLYNSLARAKEQFVPVRPEAPVRFYNCGPTVYAPFHIGNARNFVVMDVVRRWFIHRGYRVHFVMNITDVDDKIIAKSVEEGRPPAEVAEHYAGLFLHYLERLGNLSATDHPRATQFIPEMIASIEALIAKGHAYATDDGSVWFEVASFPEYGKLSKKPLDQMAQGERVNEAQQRLKKSPLDFALWKGAKEGEPAWESPWGMGRPGWHIECSCMVHEILGDTIDIHGGGVDLQFPHHENEIAQAEALSGKPFARYWLHNGFLNIQGEKMSKSLGNVLNIDEVLKRVDSLTLRLFLMWAHYRSPHDVTDDALHSAKSAARRLAQCDNEAAALLDKAAQPLGDWQRDEELASLEAQFGAAMDDDFNTPEALGALFRLVTLVNSLADAARKGDTAALWRLADALALLRDLRGVLGLTADLEPEDAPLDESGLAEQLLALLVEVRAESRKAKQFAIGDLVRDRLRAIGFALEDRPGETVWKRIDKE